MAWRRLQQVTQRDTFTSMPPATFAPMSGHQEQTNPNLIDGRICTVDDLAGMGAYLGRRHNGHPAASLRTGLHSYNFPNPQPR